jgi:hypothetical protein
VVLYSFLRFQKLAALPLLKQVDACCSCECSKRVQSTTHQISINTVSYCIDFSQDRLDRRPAQTMALSVSSTAIRLGCSSKAAFLPTRPRTSRKMQFAVRAEKGIGEKIEEATKVRVRRV